MPKRLKVALKEEQHCANAIQNYEKMQTTIIAAKMIIKKDQSFSRFNNFCQNQKNLLDSSNDFRGILLNDYRKVRARPYT